MGLTYRLHTTEDVPELIRLWSDHGGWDRVDAESWGHRLLHPPLGSSRIVLAADSSSGSIVGQLAFVPSLLSVRGREVTALRPFAPILGARVRSSLRLPNPFRHPIVEMYRQGVKLLQERGDGVVYMVPDPRWLPLLRRFPALRCGAFPLFSRPLPLDAPIPLSDEVRVLEDCDARDPRVDQLWASASKLHVCSVVRDCRTLPWKVGSGDYTLLGIERGGDLVGFVASRKKGDRQWLICDLLAADAAESLRLTLIAACNLAHRNSRAAPPDGPVAKVAILVTPVCRPVVESLGFVRDAYDFPLVVQVLDSTIDGADVAPENWYVSAND